MCRHFSSKSVGSLMVKCRQFIPLHCAGRRLAQEENGSGTGTEGLARGTGMCLGAARACAWMIDKATRRRRYFLSAQAICSGESRMMMSPRGRFGSKGRFRQLWPDAGLRGRQGAHSRDGWSRESLRLFVPPPRGSCRQCEGQAPFPRAEHVEYALSVQRPSYCRERPMMTTANGRSLVRPPHFVI